MTTPATRNGEPVNGHAQSPLGPTSLIDLLRSFADPVRLRILRLLEAQAPRSKGHAITQGTGLSVGELADILKLPQSTVSRHLKTLVDAGIAEPRRDGTSAFYRIGPAPSATMAQLRELVRDSLDQDPIAKNDGHRLAAVLRNRDSADTFFGRHAPQWDELRAKWFGETFHLEALLALLNPNWVVADIGTGTGAMLPLLAPHVSRVVAVEPNAAMLKGAKQRIKDLSLANVKVRQGTAEQLPLDDGEADVALFALVLAYTTHPESALREARRILKPGGILLLIDLQPHEVTLFREKLNHRWMGFAEPQLRTWLADAGFTAIRWHPLSPHKGRAKDAGMPIPDLFALRAEAAP